MSDPSSVSAIADAIQLRLSGAGEPDLLPGLLRKLDGDAVGSRKAFVSALREYVRASLCLAFNRWARALNMCHQADSAGATETVAQDDTAGAAAPPAPAALPVPADNDDPGVTPGVCYVLMAQDGSGSYELHLPSGGAADAEVQAFPTVSSSMFGAFKQGQHTPAMWRVEGSAADQLTDAVISRGIGTVVVFVDTRTGFVSALLGSLLTSLTGGGCKLHTIVALITADLSDAHAGLRAPALALQYGTPMALDSVHRAASMRVSLVLVPPEVFDAHPPASLGLHLGSAVVAPKLMSPELHVWCPGGAEAGPAALDALCSPSEALLEKYAYVPHYAEMMEMEEFMEAVKGVRERVHGAFASARHVELPPVEGVVAPRAPGVAADRPRVQLVCAGKGAQQVAGFIPDWPQYALMVAMQDLDVSSDGDPPPERVVVVDTRDSHAVWAVQKAALAVSAVVLLLPASGAPQSEFAGALFAAHYAIEHAQFCVLATLPAEALSAANSKPLASLLGAMLDAATQHHASVFTHHFAPFPRAKFAVAYAHGLAAGADAQHVLGQGAALFADASALCALSFAPAVAEGGAGGEAAAGGSGESESGEGQPFPSYSDALTGPHMVIARASEGCVQLRTAAALAASCAVAASDLIHLLRPSRAAAYGTTVEGKPRLAGEDGVDVVVLRGHCRAVLLLLLRVADVSSVAARATMELSEPMVVDEAEGNLRDLIAEIAHHMTPPEVEEAVHDQEEQQE